MIGRGQRAGAGMELESPPSDSISNLRFSDNSDHLLVSSWDTKVRLYDASANVLKGQFSDRGPVLDCCFRDDSSGFSAGYGTVCRYDFNTGREDLLGMHDALVPCVEYSHATGQVVTGSWDKTVGCWDARGGTRVGTYVQSDRVYSMSLVGHCLVVATAGCHITVYDLRHMPRAEQHRKSSLKQNTCCVRCLPNGTGYAVSSVEGRVAMEFFDLSEAGYAFKCNPKSEMRDAFYPINAIAFHPIYGTFATGGSDGFVNVWDGNNQKRLYQYPRYPSNIAALSFSRDGHLLAVASSYTFEEDEKLHEPDAIFVLSVSEAEVKPKPKAYVPVS